MPKLPLTAAQCGRFFIARDGRYAENAGAIFCVFRANTFLGIATHAMADTHRSAPDGFDSKVVVARLFYADPYQLSADIATTHRNCVAAGV